MAGDDHPTTPYFREQVLRKRPYLKLAWCIGVLEQPERVEKQSDGRIRHWAYVEDLGKPLRVVTLDDGRTIHNAFPDRGFSP